MHIFILSCHLEFGNCGGLGWGKICPNPLPVKHPITIQDGGIENLVYRAYCSKIMPALQASSTSRLPPHNKIVVPHQLVVGLMRGSVSYLHYNWLFTYFLTSSWVGGEKGYSVVFEAIKWWQVKSFQVQQSVYLQIELFQLQSLKSAACFYSVTILELGHWKKTDQSKQ